MSHCLHHYLSYLTPCELRRPLTPKWRSYGISWQQVQLGRDGPKLMGCCSGEKISSQMLQACGHTCWPTHTRQDIRASRKLYTGGGPPTVHKPISMYGSSVWGCVVCQRNKSEHLHPTGLLQPLLVPYAIWSDISMDFMGGFPKVGGKSVVLTVVDIFSKFAHFLALSHHYSAASVAKALFESIVHLHGFPCSIVSDRDTIFTSELWSELFHLAGVKLHISSSFTLNWMGNSRLSIRLSSCTFDAWRVIVRRLG
jgi:hypothetical protein